MHKSQFYTRRLKAYTMTITNININSEGVSIALRLGIRQEYLFTQHINILLEVLAITISKIKK